MSISHTVISNLVGKEFKSFNVKNIIGMNGQVLTVYLLKETNSLENHIFLLNKGLINYRKKNESIKKQSPSKIIEIFRDFRLNYVELTTENNQQTLSFEGVLYYNEKEHPIAFNLKVVNNELHYEYNLKNKCNLLSYENESWNFHDYLKVDGNERVFYQEQLFIGLDKHGVPLYTKDKVFLSNQNDFGIIHYNFLKNTYVICLKEKELLLNDYLHELVIVGRNKKYYNKEIDTFSNIVSLLNLLISQNKETRKLLLEVFEVLPQKEILFTINSIIEKEILNKGLDYILINQNYDIRIIKNRLL